MRTNNNKKKDEHTKKLVTLISQISYSLNVLFYRLQFLSINVVTKGKKHLHLLLLYFLQNSPRNNTFLQNDYSLKLIV